MRSIWKLTSGVPPPTGPKASMAEPAIMETLRAYSPPHIEEAERAVLSALILDNGVLPAVSAILEPGDFFSERHRIIYSAQREVALSGGLDELTLRAKLEESENLDRIGGSAYLAALDLDLLDIGRTEQYAQIIKERAQKRQLIEAAGAGG